MKVRLIHGIHQREGYNNMARFAPHMERAMPKANVSLFEYGFMGFWRARRDNKIVAERFANLSRVERVMDETEVWITHSNGAVIAYQAVRDYGASPDMIININPALDRWRTAYVPFVETIHSDGDRAVWWSQWLPFHLWGDQGKVGYRGDMHNTLSHNASKFERPMQYHGHCGAFEASRVNMWAHWCASRIMQYDRGVPV